MPNRLAQEASPYLRQHADNPVDWYPWGEEALEKARREDRPIFLSIGYSACHWCHVMERESFRDPETARILNEHFVPIKVDREERPDLDSLYMQAVMALTGHGGWPLSVFLTPDGRPFFGGTYFPPEDRGGLPGFRRVLKAVLSAWQTRRPEVERGAEALARHLARALRPAPGLDLLSPVLLDEAFQGLAERFDAQNGGFGSAPKFPQPLLHTFLLRYFARTGNPVALGMVQVTLERMTRGGIRDHLGGGFHRYAVDPYWRVPHFEKMLYDNALLALLYLQTFQVTGQPLYREVCRETLDFLLREMRHPAGGFFSSLDADSEGEEGRFYTWTRREVLDLLGPEMGEVFCIAYGVTDSGNFEGGRNVLWMPRPPEEVASALGMAPPDLEALLAQARRRLAQVREGRVRPERDDKVLTGWNGLVLSALAEAGAVLEEPRYLEAGTACARFVLEHLRVNGRLMRSWREGVVRHKGYLEDYALLGHGLLHLYEATFQRRWLDEARALTDEMLDLFWDEGEQTLYDTGRDAEPLPLRPRDWFDTAMPSGASSACLLLLRMGAYTGRDDLEQRARALLRQVAPRLAQVPEAMGGWLCALDFALASPTEVAILGPVDHPGVQALRREVFRRFLPRRVLAGADPSDPSACEGIPLLEGKAPVNGQPTAFVCERYACQAPMTNPADLARQLEG